MTYPYPIPPRKISVGAPALEEAIAKMNLLLLNLYSRETIQTEHKIIGRLSLFYLFFVSSKEFLLFVLLSPSYEVAVFLTKG